MIAQEGYFTSPCHSFQAFLCRPHSDHEPPSKTSAQPPLDTVCPKVRPSCHGRLVRRDEAPFQSAPSHSLETQNGPGRQSGRYAATCLLSTFRRQKRRRGQMQGIRFTHQLQQKFELHRNSKVHRFCACFGILKGALRPWLMNPPELKLEQPQLGRTRSSESSGDHEDFLSSP